MAMFRVNVSLTMFVEADDRDEAEDSAEEHVGDAVSIADLDLDIDEVGGAVESFPTYRKTKVQP